MIFHACLRQGSNIYWPAFTLGSAQAESLSPHLSHRAVAIPTSAEGTGRDGVMLGWPCGAEPSRTHGRRCGPDGSGRRLRPAFLRFCPIHVVRPGRLGFLQKHGALPVLVPASWFPVRNSPFVVLPGCAPAFLPGPALPPAPHEGPLVPLGGINDPSSRSHNNIPSLAKSSGQ